MLDWFYLTHALAKLVQPVQGNGFTPWTSFLWSQSVCKSLHSKLLCLIGPSGSLPFTLSHFEHEGPRLVVHPLDYPKQKCRQWRIKSLKQTSKEALAYPVDETTWAQCRTIISRTINHPILEHGTLEVFGKPALPLWRASILSSRFRKAPHGGRFQPSPLIFDIKIKCLFHEWMDEGTLGSMPSYFSFSGDNKPPPGGVGMFLDGEKWPEQIEI